MEKRVYCGMKKILELEHKNVIKYLIKIDGQAHTV